MPVLAVIAVAGFIIVKNVFVGEIVSLSGKMEKAMLY